MEAGKRIQTKVGLVLFLLPACLGNEKIECREVESCRNGTTIELCATQPSDCGLYVEIWNGRTFSCEDCDCEKALIEAFDICGW